MTQIATEAFVARKPVNKGNTTSTGTHLCLHGNIIAEWRGKQLWVTHAGWPRALTQERLNALPGVVVRVKNKQWFLNGSAWDGSWIKVKA